MINIPTLMAFIKKPDGNIKSHQQFTFEIISVSALHKSTSCFTLSLFLYFMLSQKIFQLSVDRPLIKTSWCHWIRNIMEIMLDFVSVLLILTVLVRPQSLRSYWKRNLPKKSEKLPREIITFHRDDVDQAPCFSACAYDFNTVAVCEESVLGYGINSKEMDHRFD